MRKFFLKCLLAFVYFIYVVVSWVTFSRPNSLKELTEEAKHHNINKQKPKPKNLLKMSEYQGGKVQVDHDPSEHDVEAYIKLIEGNDK